MTDQQKAVLAAASDLVATLGAIALMALKILPWEYGLAFLGFMATLKAKPSEPGGVSNALLTLLKILTAGKVGASAPGGDRAATNPPEPPALGPPGG